MSQATMQGGTRDVAGNNAGRHKLHTRYELYIYCIQFGIDVVILIALLNIWNFYLQLVALLR
jgi:hypothetical protein